MRSIAPGADPLMDTHVFLAVLVAAIMHAGWNVVVKLGLDRFSSIILLSLAQGLIALALLPLFESPAMAAWPWIAGSAVLHCGYKLFLIRAYQHADLSVAYPLARGSAPLIVAVVGVTVLGESAPPSRILAVLLIAGGVIVMSLKGGSGLTRLPPRALAYALGTAAFTASYTLADGVGARVAGTASGFTLWMFMGDGLLTTLAGLRARGLAMFPRMMGHWRSGVAAGALSLGSYWIAVWAFTLAPLAQVAALRETSVLFAMFIAVAFLGEKAGRWRWFAAALILSGVVMMRL